MGGGTSRALAGAALAVALALAPGTASAQELTFGTDYGGFRNVLPGGQGETVNALELAQMELTGEAPATFTNQLGLYTDIVGAAPTLTPPDVERFFKSASFGVPAEEVASTVRPRAGVTIQRDRMGVPHVFGETSGDVAFGAGYASAQDRLFLMDVLRHTARGRLTELIGAGENDSTVRMDAEQLKVADYSEEELDGMIDTAVAAGGPEAPKVKADAEQFIAGINAYLAEARADGSKMPVEYAALGQPQGPADWKLSDFAALASLIGGIFGKGGGGEADVSQVLLEVEKRFGRRGGRRVFRDFRTEDDPEAPHTIGRRFRFDRPARGKGAGVAVLDLDSIQARNPVVSGGSTSSTASGPSWIRELQRRGVVFPEQQSNVMLVNAKRSKSGRAFAIMGPQVGYYSPQILMEMDLHGGGYDARGATFPGLSLYVLLGRGQDYSWSATTATTDVVDQFVEVLCNPDGSAPDRASTHYLYKGKCIPFTEREYTVNTPVPVTDPQPSRAITFRTQRSVHGPVQGTATVKGRPVAIANGRSTFFHELDSTNAFRKLNVNEVRDPASFQRTMGTVNFAFNWFYVDDRHVAYLNSGWYPRRARGTDPSLPTWGTGEFDWQGFKPAGNVARRMPYSSLPKAVDPPSGYIVNWNNKQAPGWRSADDVWSYGPVQRSQILEKPLQRTLRRDGKTDLTRLVRINIEGATVDLRGREVYPLLRRAIGATSEAQAAPLLRLLDAWRKAGAHRRDLDGDNVYEHSAAVAIMDAWWPRLVSGAFKPALGNGLFDRLQRVIGLGSPPGPGGSSFFDGWHGYVSKDLRRLLGMKVRAPLSRPYCGGGSRARCREALLNALVQAGAHARKVHGGVNDYSVIKVPATCGSPRRCDQIEFTTAGAVPTAPIPFQNRPTFQQAVEIQGHRPR